MTTSSLHLGTIAPRSTPRRSRRGRGNASRGNYSGRGIKGQRARSGGRRGTLKRSLKHLLFRVPKQRGFKQFGLPPVTVTIATLERYRDRLPQAVTPAVLLAHGLVPRRRGEIRVVGTGDLSKPFRVHAHGFSAQAEAAIMKAGGNAVLIGSKPAKTDKKLSTIADQSKP